MLSWPSTTAYDLKFNLLGIPVRVNPWFWLTAALLGGIGRSSVNQVAIWIGCVFVSILVHEMGHGLTARFFGSPAQVVLYMMGGLCRSEVDARYHPLQRIAVILMGPGAGFLLCGLTMLGGMFAFGMTPLELLQMLVLPLGLNVGEVGPGFFRFLQAMRSESPAALIFWNLVYINFMWGLLNLLPIWPLDGGQFTGVVLGQVQPSHGRRWTHVVGLLTAGVMAYLSYQYTGDLYRTAFFGVFALSNYQILQTMHQQSRFGGMGDDEDWWRR